MSRPTMPRMMRSSVTSPPVASSDSITAPSRMTVIVSATDSTSLSLCEIRTHAMPCARNSRRSCSSAWESFSLREDVGSSRIRSSTFLDSALAISTSCCLPTPRWLILVSGVSSRPTFLSSPIALECERPQLMTPRLACSLARKMFSVIDSCGTSASSWWMMTIPLCSLSRMLWKRHSSPLKKNWPS